MRLSHFLPISVLSVSILFPSAAIHQRTPISGSSEAASDARAVALIQQINDRAGWTRDWSVITLAFQAKLMPADRSANTRTVNLSVEFDGTNRMKAAAEDGVDSSTFIVDGKSGAVVSAGETASAPSEALWQSCAVLPFLSDLVATEDTAVTYSYGGTTDLRGSKVHVIVVHRASSIGRTSGRHLNALALDTTFWISPETLLPIQSEVTIPTWSDPFSSIKVIRQFSDYRVVNGIAVPFSIQVSTFERPIFTISIQDVQFGVSFPDSDFKIQ